MAERGWQRSFETFAADLIGQHQIPAVAVAVAQDGETIYEAGFGHRDAAGRLPVTPDTRFGMGSVTKSFPSLAIVQLAEAGRLAVDDPVVRWLPEFRLPGEDGAAYTKRGAPPCGPPRVTPAVTIHHFMTHASGIPPEPSLLHARAQSICDDPDFERMHPKPLDVPADVCTFERVSTYEDLMALIARQDFAVLGSPGQVLSYCNEGYVLLGAIVERASGQSLAAYLQQHILGPLGMTRSGLYSAATPPNEPEVVPFAVDTRGGTKKVFASPAWWDQGQMWGNGGLKSTTRDMLRYLEVYRTGGQSHGARIVSAAGVERMTAPHMTIPTGGFYGYGLITNAVPGVGRIVEHSGGNKGVSTHVAMVPEHGLTAVTLTNLANAPASKLNHAAINACLGLAPDAPWAVHPAYDIDPRQLERFVGTYRGMPGVLLHISVKDGTLYAQHGDEPQPAQPYAERAFYVPALDQELRFLEDERGKVGAVAYGLRTYPRVS